MTLTSSVNSGSSVLGDLPESFLSISDVVLDLLNAWQNESFFMILARFIAGESIDKVPSSSSELGLTPLLFFLRPSNGVDFSAQYIS